MLPRLAALVLCGLAFAPAARAQGNAYPINGEDGTPVLNHKVPEDALAVLEKLPRAVTVGNPASRRFRLDGSSSRSRKW